MESGVSKMEVWIVAGSVHYEGDCVNLSGEVFLNHEDAVKYGQSLLAKGWDNYVIKSVEVK